MFLSSTVELTPKWQFLGSATIAFSERFEPYVIETEQFMLYPRPPTSNRCGIYRCWIVDNCTESRYKSLSKDSDPRLLLLCVIESHKDCLSGWN